jgi:hypothetical protein
MNILSNLGTSALRIERLQENLVRELLSARQREKHDFSHIIFKNTSVDDVYL